MSDFSEQALGTLELLEQLTDEQACEEARSRKLVCVQWALRTPTRMEVWCSRTKGHTGEHIAVKTVKSGQEVLYRWRT